MNNRTGGLRFFKINSTAQLFLLCTPALILLLLFNYIPMGGLIVAFQDYRVDKGLLGSEWIGLKNFEFFFQSDTAWRITRNTVGYNAVIIVLSTTLAVGFAILLNEITRKLFAKIYQTLMFIPYFLSWVIVSSMLFAFLEPSLGFLNRILVGLGIQPPNWYFAPEYWPYIIVVMAIWKSLGYTSLIYFAALLGIDREYYEAASIDGASKLTMMLKITLPFLMPLISLLTLISIGRIFSGNFDMFYNLPKDNGILYSTTDVIDTYVYRSLRVMGDTGMAIAAGFYQSVVGFVLVLVSNYLIKRTNEDNAVF
ncbi:sugar ABC transporter permease [Paenibacillus agaridevorans]|uniref:Sugar ABC transporter permease n=1 Tax=Paenibacillus agaridevorans TaxID=171404 RepID=A0A2R5EQ55_9BACL|nr:ABC transporter permease subunit [Paenibacillus agaridevorans]GBG05561.1 sugar ABC transporter permease [Paenibacillus agaridevorans]